MDLQLSTYAAPRARWARVWPFTVTFALALLLAVVSPGGSTDIGLVSVAAALIVGCAFAVILVPWSELPEALTLVPVAALCVAVDLLRAGSSGGSAAGYGSVLLIPVIWQALHRKHAELWATIALVAAANVISVVFISSAVDAASQWRSVILFTVVAVTIGETIRRLVADRAALLEQVATDANRDPLTALPNRRVWEDHLVRELTLANRRRTPLAIAIFDLDHFKSFNDEHGHLAGDRLLVEAADTWRANLRSSDLLVRWGGEEFALLMPVTDENGARTLLDRLQTVTPKGQTFSAGFTVHRSARDIQAEVDPSWLVEAADRALYAAKAAGRARAELADTLVVTPDVEPTLVDA